ncbi:MAG: DUF4160 domain-containing protein [Planctomycetota bacterium]|nr:DUF4160 domain-containing protein [Planctomycetota bacterium]
MGKVEAFHLAGIECWFYSDDHRPPHFHAKKAGEWQVKVSFLMPEEEMIECEWRRKSISGKHQRALMQMATVNRAALLRQWEQKVRVNDDERDS